MLPNKITFIDLETTGLNPVFNRVIEIGIIKVERDGNNYQQIKEFQTLINPDIYLPADITNLTGITQKEIDSAPTFREIKDEILDFFSDSIMVAHNVRFDYSFLKNELKRQNVEFSPKHFCTAKLSKFLFSKYRHHNLDSIIERFNLSCPNRHRAFDDTKIIWDFFQLSLKQFGEEKINQAIDFVLKKPSLPNKIKPEVFSNLPESCGVYILYGAKQIPLYIGKSKNIKTRLSSHFTGDLTSSKEMRISQQVEHIETITTSGELGALLLESKLIKEYQPLYNRKLRVTKQLICIKKIVNKKGIETVQFLDFDFLDPKEIGNIVGVFSSKKKAINFLRSLAKEKNLCEVELGIEITKGTSCFGYQLGKCRGVCINKESKISYNLKAKLSFSEYQFKSWPYISPIIISEVDPINGKEEGFVIDNWIFLGKIKVDEFGDENYIPNSKEFDLDVYKILTQYIKKSKQKNIKKISNPNIINEFFQTFN